MYASWLTKWFSWHLQTYCFTWVFYIGWMVYLVICLYVNLDTLKRPHLTSLFVNKCMFPFMHTKTGLYMAIIFHVNHIMKQTFEVNEHGCFTPVFSYKCRRCFRAPGSGFQDKSKANTAEPQQRSLGWFPNERTCKNRFSLGGAKFAFLGDWDWLYYFSRSVVRLMFADGWLCQGTCDVEE